MGVVVDNSESAVRNGIESILSEEPTVSQIPTKFKNVLVVAKKTRWDFEQERLPHLSDEELEAHLRARGSNVAELRAKHNQQKELILNGILRKLESFGIACDMLTRNNYPEAIKKADLILSAGGDGTFLTAAAAVTDNKKPVIGINSDPVGSEGHLCVGGKNPPPDLIERIANGRFRWSYRNRIRVTIINGKQKTTERILALNEVFIGEKEAAKVSYYEVGMDDQPMVKQKSSGMVVCTGTGSPAWNYSINRIEEKNVSGILEVLRGMGVSLGNDLHGLASQVVDKFNEKLVFDPDHPNMSFTIREPIFNATFARTETRGFCSKLRLKSRCSDAYLVLDGTRKIKFNHGTEVILQIHEEDALKTISLQ